LVGKLDVERLLAKGFGVGIEERRLHNVTKHDPVPQTYSATAITRPEAKATSRAITA